MTHLYFPMNIFQSFLEYYANVRKRTVRLLNSIPFEQFNFAYKAGKFSIADHIRHIATVERLMFGETIAGRKSLYKGCGPELGDKPEEVLQFFHQMHDETIEIIKDLKENDWDRLCETPSGVKISMGKWLQLLAEHEIHHRAQLYLYANMLGLKTPPMYGLSSEELAGMGN